jgi:phosphoribosyl 1,2-cyclic phosphodiesterase
MLRFRSLGSGSTGNAALVEATSGGRTSRLLIDCGFGLKQLDLRLARAGLAAGDIDAIFVTHEHGDHIGCAHSLSRRNRIPVWMSEGTWLATGAATSKAGSTWHETKRNSPSAIFRCSPLPCRTTRASRCNCAAPTARAPWAC